MLGVVAGCFTPRNAAIGACLPTARFLRRLSTAGASDYQFHGRFGVPASHQYCSFFRQLPGFCDAQNRLRQFLPHQIPNIDFARSRGDGSPSCG
jgi:hypothetical protein